MPKGASRSITVLTKSNSKFFAHLLIFVKEHGFVTRDEIYKECMKCPKSSTSRRHHGLWGLRPTRNQLCYMLRLIPFLQQSDYVLMRDNSKGRLFETKNLFWELTPNWETDYSNYIEYLREQKEKRKHLGGKWA